MRLLCTALLLAFGLTTGHARNLAEISADVRALGWAPTSAELSLLDSLPRPPTLNLPADRKCTPSRPAFETPAAEAEWTRRRPARALTIWGVAHLGSAVADKNMGTLCQDLLQLAKSWQAALGHPVTGTLTELEVGELSRAISDAIAGNRSSFGALTVGLDAKRTVPRPASPDGTQVAAEAALAAAQQEPAASPPGATNASPASPLPRGEPQVGYPAPAKAASLDQEAVKQRVSNGYDGSYGGFVLPISAIRRTAPEKSVALAYGGPTPAESWRVELQAKSPKYPELPGRRAAQVDVLVYSLQADADELMAHVNHRHDALSLREVSLPNAMAWRASIASDSGSTTVVVQSCNVVVLAQHVINPFQAILHDFTPRLAAAFQEPECRTHRPLLSVKKLKPSDRLVPRVAWFFNEVGMPDLPWIARPQFKGVEHEVSSAPERYPAFVPVGMTVRLGSTDADLTLDVYESEAHAGTAFKQSTMDWTTGPISRSAWQKKSGSSFEGQVLRCHAIGRTFISDTGSTEEGQAIKAGNEYLRTIAPVLEKLACTR